MSCPHPSGPTEREVGGFVELVCRDCAARLAPIAPEPDEDAIVAELEIAEGLEEVDAIQAVYDAAFAEGILDEPQVFSPDSGVIAARIEDGALVETVAGDVPESLADVIQAHEDFNAYLNGTDG